MKKIILSTIASLLVATTFSQTTVYVDIDASGNNDATSWSNAYNNPQDAFDNVNLGDDVWIAEGTYVRQTSNRAFTFVWGSDSVSVYGGFDGTETALSQRDWENNPTIFSGEIQGDNDLTNNSYTVLAGPYSNSATNKINYSLIDGITISDGYATTFTSIYPTRWGAGFYFQQNVKNIKFNNCLFTNNTAQGAAAMYVSADSDSTNVEIFNTKFIGNKSSFANCIWSQATTNNPLNVRILNCLFTDNINKEYGGVPSSGLFYFSSNGNQANILVSLINSTITNNIDSVVTSSTNSQLIMLNKTSDFANSHLEVGNCILFNNPGFNRTTRNYSYSGFDFAPTGFITSISDINSYVNNTFLSQVYTHDPLFTNPSTGDFTLQPTSPAIDSGTVVGTIPFPTYDLAGLTRISGNTIDLGCYEYQTAYADITENKEFAVLNLFPNPTTGNVTFESEEDLEAIEIFSLTGQKVISFANTNKIDISELTPGVYMARVSAGKKVSTQRIIKQ